MKVDNAYAPVGWFYRVNSVFYDPSIYGRFLVDRDPRERRAGALRGRAAGPWARGGVAAVTMVGLDLLVLAVELRLAGGRDLRRPRRRSGAGRRSCRSRSPPRCSPSSRWGCPSCATGCSARPGSRTRPAAARRSSRTGSRSSSTTRSIGVGTGGFSAEGYHRVASSHGGRASHTAPITVAAETGLPGLAAPRLAARRRRHPAVPPQPRREPLDRARLGFGLALLAVAVHSLFYNALIEDPLFWAALALPRSPGARSSARDRPLGAGARARAAHRRRRVRVRRHDGPARRGGRRGPLRRLLDRDPVAARKGSRRTRCATRSLRRPPSSASPPSTSRFTTSTCGRSPTTGRRSSSS